MCVSIEIINLFKLNNMETLKQKIVADYILAFKSGEKIKKNLLGVIKGEITTIEKNTNVDNLEDAEVIKVLTKISKNTKETLSVSDNEESRTELSVVELYLPKQMSELEIRSEVELIISEIGAKSPAEMGKVMSGFTAKHAGKADGKLVSTIVKELLTVKV